MPVVSRRAARKISEAAASARLVESLEKRLLLTTTLEYYPVHPATGQVQPPVTYQWDLLKQGGTISELPLEDQPLFSRGYSGSQHNLYLRLDGVQGESTDTAHKDWILLESFAWGADSRAQAGLDFNSLRVVAPLSKATPKLMQHLASGVPIANGDLAVQRAGPDGGIDFLTVDMNQVLISSYEMLPAADGMLREEFTLSFASTTLQYVPITAKGTAGAPITFSWDLVKSGGTMSRPTAPHRSLLEYGNVSSQPMFLRIDGIVGDSADAAHKQWINVESFSWGMHNASPNVALHELRFTAQVSRASPLLMERLTKGAGGINADFAVQRLVGGEQPYDFLTIDANNVQVSSYAVQARPGRMVEEFTLSFSDLTLQYVPLTATGKQGVPVSFSYDLVKSGGGMIDVAPPQRPLLDANPSGAVDMFLRLDGIVGQSTDSMHKDWIDVSSFSWGLDRRSAGALAFNELQFTAPVSRASPLLMQRLSTGTLVGNADFAVRSLGEPGHVFYALDVDGVQISSYRVSTAANGELYEQFTLGFSAVTTTYQGVDAKGALLPAVTSSWNLIKGGGTIEPLPMSEQQLLTRGYAQPAHNLYLRLDGVLGQSADAAHKDWINLESFDWSVDGQVNGPAFSSLRVVAPVSRATPLLMDRLARGALIPNGDLAVQRTGGDGGFDYYTVNLKDVQVSSYEMLPGADGQLREEFTLTFVGTTLVYRYQSPSGSLVPYTFSWELMNGGSISSPAVPARSLLDNPAPSASPMYLRVDQVPGESTDAAHKDWINLTSFSWGMHHRPGSLAFHELRFAAPVSKASPLLMQGASKATLFGNVDFAVQALAGGSQAYDFFTVDASAVQVSSYAVRAVNGIMTEEFTLSFSSVAAQFTPLTAKGTLGPTTTFSHDLISGGGGMIDVAPPQRPLLNQTTPAAANNMFVRIDGIPGESASDAYKDWIDVTSFSWGVDKPSAASPGGPGGDSLPAFHEIQFTARTSKASPLLMDRLARAATIGNGDFVVRKSLGDGQFLDFYRIDLNRVAVSSYAVTTAANGEVFEQVTLRYDQGDPVNQPPAATLSSSPTVVGGSATHQFTVRYDDDVAIDVSTIGTGDVLVTGPNGYSQVAAFVSIDLASNGTPRFATYSIPAPGGFWDSTDNGTYTIALQANQVADTQGAAVSAGTLGTFNPNAAFAVRVAATGVLVINGTSGNDVLALGLSGGNLLATRGTETLAFASAGVSAVEVRALAGDDTFAFNGPVTQPVSFFGDSGSDVLNVLSGVYTFFADAGQSSTSLTVNVSAGAETRFASSQRLTALNVSGKAAMLPSSGGGATRALRTTALSVTGAGQLDLNEHSLIVDYAGASPLGGWSGDAYTGITGLLASGRADGDWNGAGIVSSAAAGSNDYYTLGVAEAAEALGLSSGETMLWNGLTVDATSVLVKFTYGGDANLDGLLNIDDYGQIDFNVGLSGMVFGFFNGDFNLDGLINIDDYGVIDFNIGIQGPPLENVAPSPSPSPPPRGDDALVIHQVLDLLGDGEDELVS